MASLCTRRNPPFSGKDKLVGALTKGNSIPTVFRASTLALVQAPAPTLTSASAPASAPGPLRRYIDKELQRATKLALELFIKG